jgi:hypothetical protein
VVIPLASRAGLSSPSALLVLYHELLELFVELLLGEATRLVATLNVDVAAVCLSKIHFALLEPNSLLSTLAETFHQSGRSGGFPDLRPRSECGSLDS